MNQPSAYTILRASESHRAQDDDLGIARKTSFEVHAFQLERFIATYGGLGLDASHTFFSAQQAHFLSTSTFQETAELGAIAAPLGRIIEHMVRNSS